MDTKKRVTQKKTTSEYPPSHEIILTENQKKCPQGYERYPPKSNKCRLKNVTRKTTAVIHNTEDANLSQNLSQSLDKDLAPSIPQDTVNIPPETVPTEHSATKTPKQITPPINVSSKLPSLNEASSIKQPKKKVQNKPDNIANLPENVPLQNKKCPPNYERYPKGSQNCRLKKSTRTTRKQKSDTLVETKPILEPATQVSESVVPKIIAKDAENIEVRPSETQVGEDISIHQSKLSDDSISIEDSIRNEDSISDKDSEKTDDNSEQKEDLSSESPLPEKTFNSEKAKEYDYLYPSIEDSDFSVKIANKKEFGDYRYDGTIHNVVDQSEIECKSSFEIMPHQQFVKNFLSLQTPYNSLLLYHELGSGKTCTAIGVTEEMRAYMKQIGGIRRKILIVASPNVQANFRLQLFDPNRLIEMETGSGIWTLDTCVGNDLLREINPTQMPLKKEYIIRKINNLIQEYYDFIGYDSLANEVEEVGGMGKTLEDEEMEISEYENKAKDKTKSKENEESAKRLKRVFDNRLIVIDEVHNIIGREDNENKHRSNMLLKLVKTCENLRLLFLSATPMYNSHKEIIWLANIMNLNDQRSTIKVSQVFNEDGSFVEENKNKEGVIVKESGRDLLKRKFIGYVSYVRGENPYSFPFRIYPASFADSEHRILAKTYPKNQMNGFPISSPIQYMDVYVTNLGEYQQKGYQKILDYAKTHVAEFSKKESFGYILLQEPISALNMIYPNIDFDEMIDSNSDNIRSIIHELHGQRGLNSIITYKEQMSPHPLAYDFEYKPSILEKYGRVFHKENIGKYSAKIAKICEIIENSTGIVLIYSKYIEGGLIPMALALEEMGLNRYGAASYTRSLFKEKPEGIPKMVGQQYVMITGQKMYSPNNNADLKLVTDPSNKYGEQVRVVLISEAGSEGLDFKNIRQVHILDPWYNMNRIEQVIGRAVRTKSHCSLPFKERNVEIYMHGTYLDSEEESADLYMYRLAEKKAIINGQVTRVLKETAVDCLLNIDQTNFTPEKIGQNVPLQLSHQQKQIDFVVGDKPFSNMCDYMENCSFKCTKDMPSNTAASVPADTTYDHYFLQNNHSRISKRIRQIFREKMFYTFDHLVREIHVVKPFPLEQIYYTLSIFLKNKDWIVNKYGRKGYLIQNKDVYAFQPIEIQNERTSIFERSVPLDYKKKSISIELSEKEPVGPSSPIPDRSVATPSSIENKTPKNKSLQLWDILIEHILYIFSQTSYVKPGKMDYDFYRYAKLSVRICIQNHNLEVETCQKYIAFHYLDNLTTEDKIRVLTGISELLKSTKNSDEPIIRRDLKLKLIEWVTQYFEERMDPSKLYLLLNRGLQNTLYRRSSKSENDWKEVDMDTVRDHLELEIWMNKWNKRESLLQHINKYVNAEDKSELNIGFMGVFKESFGFKIKNLLNERPNPGALCQQADKKKLIGKLNDFLKANDRENEIYSMDPVFSNFYIERPNICIIYEFLLRFLRETENKIWFLNAEESISSQLDQFVAIPQTIRGETVYVLKAKK